MSTEASASAAAAAEEPSRVIIMPVDSSEHSERAFLWYVKHVHKPVDLVMFIHIVEPLSGSGTVKATAVTEEFNKALKEATDEGKSLGHIFIQRAKTHQVRVKFLLHVGNKPGEHVVRMAKEHNADMIIMGNRGIGTIRRTLLGSVSDYIIHHTDVACVVVPPGKANKKDKKKTPQSSISADSGDVSMQSPSSS